MCLLCRGGGSCRDRAPMPGPQVRRDQGVIRSTGTDGCIGWVWPCGAFRPLPSDDSHSCRDQTERGTAQASSAARRRGCSGLQVQVRRGSCSTYLLSSFPSPHLPPQQHCFFGSRGLNFHAFPDTQHPANSTQGSRKYSTTHHGSNDNNQFLTLSGAKAEHVGMDGEKNHSPRYTIAKD